MKRSRLTLARMEAAAMEGEMLSPFTTHQWGTVMAAERPWSRFPSIRAKSGRRESPSMASCMALIRALRISVRSISSASTRATDQASALCWMSGKSASRFFSVSFLESFRPGMSAPWARITAAAYTGPARGPAPASSQPQTRTKPASTAFCSYSPGPMPSFLFSRLLI